MRIAAKVISYLFQPVFMPLIAVYLLFSVDSAVVNQSHPEVIKRVLILLGGLTVLMPLFSLYVMYNAKVIADLELNRRKDRLPVFLMTLFYFGASYYLLSSYVPTDLMHPLIFSALTGVIISTIIAATITTFWKISIHMVGVAGLLGLFIALPRVVIQVDVWLVVVLFILTGLVGTARMREGAHNLPQIFAGFVLGFAVEYLCIRYMFAF